MRIDAASAKRRDAGPGDYPSVGMSRVRVKPRVETDSLDQQDIANEDLRSKVWAGIIPIEYSHGTPQPTEYNQVEKPKAYWGDRDPSL